MAKVFNVTGACRPEKHYMVNLESRLRMIRKMVDDGEYFTINRARQFGKTTILYSRQMKSVILAGVYDIRNIRRKIRPEEEHKTNSPWNISADFNVDMSFSVPDISGMLQDYEADYHTGMNIQEISEQICRYTSGYPYLSSRLCKLIDEQIAGNNRFTDKSAAWTKDGLLEAVRILVNETNALFLSLKRKVADYPKLRSILYDLLFTGKPAPYTAMNDAIEIAAMFGFIRNENGTAVIHNRIFETVLYNWFMSEEYSTSKMYDVSLKEIVPGGTD